MVVTKRAWKRVLLAIGLGLTVTALGGCCFNWAVGDVGHWGGHHGGGGGWGHHGGGGWGGHGGGWGGGGFCRR